MFLKTAAKSAPNSPRNVKVLCEWEQVQLKPEVTGICINGLTSESTGDC